MARAYHSLGSSHYRQVKELTQFSIGMSRLVIAELMHTGMKERLEGHERSLREIEHDHQVERHVAIDILARQLGGEPSGNGKS